MHPICLMEPGSVPHLWCSTLLLPLKSQVEVELFPSCLPEKRAALSRLSWSQTMASWEKTVVFSMRSQICKRWLKKGLWSPPVLAVFPSVSAGSATLTALPAAEISQVLPYLWQCQVRHFCSQSHQQQTRLQQKEQLKGIHVLFFGSRAKRLCLMSACPIPSIWDSR